jgi:uncharacterized protein (TIGR00106 family)
MSVILNLSIFPMDKGESVSEYVAMVVQVIRNSGLAHLSGPMGTAIEGEWDGILGLLSDCYRALEPHANRIHIQATFDCRKGSGGRLEQKMASLKSRIDEGRY